MIKGVLEVVLPLAMLVQFAMALGLAFAGSLHAPLCRYAKGPVNWGAIFLRSGRRTRSRH